MAVHKSDGPGVARLSRVMGLRLSIAALLVAGVALPARAQVSSPDRTHHLVVDPSVILQSNPHPALSESPKVSDSTAPFDVRSLVDSVTGALTSTPNLRAADAAVGSALIALGARRHHPMSSALFVGAHAIDLAIERHLPAAARTLDIQPDVSRGRVAITVRRSIR